MRHAAAHLLAARCPPCRQFTLASTQAASSRPSTQPDSQTADRWRALLLCIPSLTSWNCCFLIHFFPAPFNIRPPRNPVRPEPLALSPATQHAPTIALPRPSNASSNRAPLDPSSRRCVALCLLPHHPSHIRATVTPKFVHSRAKDDDRTSSLRFPQQPRPTTSYSSITSAAASKQRCVCSIVLAGRPQGPV